MLGCNVPYICGVTIREFSAFFRSELDSIYSSGEVDAMWKWFLSEHFPEQMDPIKRSSSAIIHDALLSKVKSDLYRLRLREPLQYVIGHTFFFGMQLSVDNRVLIPRPETEEMLELISAQRGFHPEVIVDLCTGSGCIALGLKKSFPLSKVMAIDVAPGAIELASQNSRDLGLHVECVGRDILTDGWMDALPEQTNLVVSNPPYILPSEADSMDTSVLDFEPSVALFVPTDDPLLFYRPIADFARKTLAMGGQLWFEINPNTSTEMAQMLGAFGFSSIEITKDLSGKFRFVKAVQ